MPQFSKDPKGNGLQLRKKNTKCAAIVKREALKKKNRKAYKQLFKK